MLFFYAAGRNLADIQTQLQRNSEAQQFLQREVEHKQLAMLSEEIKEKIEVGDMSVCQ